MLSVCRSNFQFSHRGIGELMKSKYRFKSGEEGKGSLGCIFALALMVSAIFLVIKLGPIYFNHFEFKGDLKQAASHAGAHSVASEIIKRDVKALAQKSKIILKDEDIVIDRSIPTRLIIEIKYTVPVDFIIIKRDIVLKAKEESFTLI